MADEYISQVQLPNNETYDIKDKNAITEIQIVGETQTKTNGVVNLPARVTQSNSSSTSFRPILTGYESWSSMESYTTGSVTNNIYKSAKAFLRTSNGTFYGGYFVAANPVSGGSGNTAKRVTLNSDGLYANNYLDGYSIPPYERQIIQAYAGKCFGSAGLLLRIDSGGLTIVGGGESSQKLSELISNDQTIENPERLDINNSAEASGKETTALTGDSEELILSSDDAIYFATNCQTIENRGAVCLNKYRTFYPMTNNTGKIGSSNYKWQYGYFGQVYGTSGSGKWKVARDKASFINSTPPNENAYAPAIDLKTTSGDWSIGTLDSDENLYFAYVADSIYSGSTNVVRKYNLQAPSTPDSNTYDILHSGNTSFTQTLSSGTKIGTITINGTDTVLYCQTNTNTWRNIKVNGTEKLDTGTGAGALDFINGANTTVTYDSGVKIDATDEKVNQNLYTGSASCPILFASVNNADTNTTVNDAVRRSNNIYLNPTSGASRFKGNGPVITLQDTVIDLSDSSNGVSATQTRAYRLRDKNNWLIADFYSNIGTNTISTGILCYNRDKNDPSNTTYSAGIAIKVTKTGTVSYNVDKPDKFRTAIEAIGGSGTSGYLAKFDGARSLTNGPQLGSSTTTYLRNDGTWTTPANTTYILSTGDSNGQIKVTPSSGNAYNVDVKGLGDRAFDSTEYLPLIGGTVTGAINFKSSNLDRNNPPSSETASDAYCNFQDKNGNYIGRVVSAMNENGDIELILRARARNAADTGYIINDFKIIKSRNGTNSYYISSPTNFREAIEVYSKLETETSIRSYLTSTIGHSCKNQFEITGSTTTVNEVTFTVNKTAGTVKATGAASPAASRAFTIGTFTFKPGKTYILSGCPSGGGGSSYRLYPQSLGSAYYDNGEGATITVQEEKTVNIRCIIYPANTTATVTFKPMIRDASIADDTFDPYVTPTDEKKQDKPVELDITTEWTIAEWIDLLNKYNYLQIITYTDVSFNVAIVPLSIFSNTTQEIRTISYASHANGGSVTMILFASNGQKMIMGLDSSVNIYKIIGIPK